MVSQAEFPRRGEIWLAQFPDDPKSRPALIVSINARNEFSNNVLAVPLTTNLRPAPTQVLLPRGHGGLHVDSMARCENVSYIRRFRLQRSAFKGQISIALMHEIQKSLARSFGIPTL